MRLECNRVRRRLLQRSVGLAAIALATCGALGGANGSAEAQGARKKRSQNVVLVLIDGLRWQEVFTGADEKLIDPTAGGVKNPEPVKKAFVRPTPEARREVLMPFLWGTVAKQGQLWGNRLKGSPARVTNTHHFSYPGYSEMIVGYPDPRIDSNDKKPNPNVTVFEWLHRKPRFQEKVAAFGAWDVVPWIVNRERCGFFVNAGWEPVTGPRLSPRQEMLNQLKAEMTRPWDWGPPDTIFFHSALEYLKTHRPRATWLTFGETDEWAHERRYDRYLEAARGTDFHLKTLWETLQATPQYRNRTTLIVAVDHGRGRTDRDWTNHNNKTPGADEIWIAAIGPDIAPKGERQNAPKVTQAQIAASVAEAVGEDYRASVPQAAIALPTR